MQIFRRHSIRPALQARQPQRSFPAALRIFSLVAATTLVLFGWDRLPAADNPAGADPFASVFIDDPSFGKDPFFPESTRRKVTPTNGSEVVRVPTASLELKGLSGPEHRRLAIINNYTFGVGEEYDIRLDDKSVKVRCLQIRDDSVVVTVGGITRELHLKGDLPAQP